jgi:hypothetical protein
LRAIKGLFRDAAKALTWRVDDEPPPRRRRDETDKGFSLAAKAALRRAIRVSEETYAATTDILIGTLDCMNPWPNDADNFKNLDDDCNNTDKNYPSLHL